MNEQEPRSCHGFTDDRHIIFGLPIHPQSWDFKLPMMILIQRNFFIFSFVTLLALPILVMKRMLVCFGNNPHNSSVKSFWNSSNGLSALSER